MSVRLKSGEGEGPHPFFEPFNLTKGAMSDFEHQGERRAEKRELKEGAPLLKVLEHIDWLTRERNDAQNPESVDRYDHLSLGATSLGDTILTKKFSEDERQRAFHVEVGRIFVELVGLLQILGTKEELIESMLEQYETCHRCKHVPCTCNPSDAGFTEGLPPAVIVGKETTLSEWQGHLKRLYGGNNAVRSRVELYALISLEIAEARRSAKDYERLKAKGDADPSEIEKTRKEAIEELAQAVAWLIGFCVHPDSRLNGKQDIPLEEVLVRMYGNEEKPDPKKPFTTLVSRKDPGLKPQLDKLTPIFERAGS